MRVPKVSVVTPIYNGEEFVYQVAQNVLNINYENYEWVIINDGSSDRTLEKVRDVAQKSGKIKVISPGRVGFVKALNIGISNAKGEYIARQDVDDISYSERLTEQVSLLESSKSIGVVGAFYKKVDKNRNEKYLRKLPTNHSEIVESMCKYIPLPHTLATFKKSAWVDVEGYPNADNITDLRLWIQFVKSGWKIKNVPKVLGEHVVHRDSYWNSNFNSLYRQLDLAFVQSRAVYELDMPRWKLVYPFSRPFYRLLPDHIKCWVRRNLSGLSEKDL